MAAEERSTDGGLSVGQRLTRIETRLDTLIGSMQKLAEEADLRALLARVELLEREGSVHARRAEAATEAISVRVAALETQEAVAVAIRSNRRWIIGLLLAMAGWASVILAVVTYYNHH